jgi:hypothetical protein
VGRVVDGLPTFLASGKRKAWLFSDLKKNKRPTGGRALATRVAEPISFGQLQKCGHERRGQEIKLMHHSKIILLVKAFRSN